MRDWASLSVCLEAVEKRKMSVNCLEWKHESCGPWLSLFTDWATRGDVMEMCMRRTLQTLGSIATYYVSSGSVPMNSVRICVLVLLITSDPNSFMLTHMARVQRGSQWNITVEQRSLFTSLCSGFVFFTCLALVPLLAACEKKEKPTSIRHDPNRRPLCTWLTGLAIFFYPWLSRCFFFKSSFFSFFFFFSKSVSRDFLLCLEKRGGYGISTCFLCLIPLFVLCVMHVLILFTNSRGPDIVQAKPCHFSVALVWERQQLNHTPFLHMKSDCYSCRNYGSVAFEFVRSWGDRAEL